MPLLTRRLLVDSNVWSLLGRARQARQFHRIVAESNCELFHSPSVLLEISRPSNVKASRRDLDAMLAGPWHPLRTEADYIAEDLIAEFARVRPGWLRPSPDLSARNQWRAIWTTDLWRRARKDWPAFVSWYRDTPDPDAKQAYESQQVARDALGRDRRPASQPQYVQCPPGLPREVRNIWPASPGLELWRAEARNFFTSVLREAASPALVVGGVRNVSEWLEDFVNPAAALADDVSWARFWINDVEAANMPHHWMNMTAQRYQVARRVQESNARDSQHASYLVEADLFLTSDSRFAGTLDDLRRDAPFDFAGVVQVSGRETTLLDEVEAGLTEE